MRSCSASRQELGLKARLGYRGLLAYDDKVAKHWPEFAQNGKEGITIADVLRHDAGLQAFDEAITLDDTELQADPSGNMSRIIAAQKPRASQVASGKASRAQGRLPLARATVLRLNSGVSAPDGFPKLQTGY